MTRHYCDQCGAEVTKRFLEAVVGHVGGHESLIARDFCSYACLAAWAAAQGTRSA